MAPTTPSQTVGPFFHYALLQERLDELVDPSDPAALRLTGTVLDGAGEPVSDGMVEIWQADADGRYATGPLAGFGRAGTDERGSYSFVTIKPGRVPAADGRLQAPHIELAVFARGLVQQPLTRVYFPDEEQANAEDPLLASIDDPARRALLVARPDGDVLRFDVRLQGQDATPFLALNPEVREAG
jgi:protocatechuate 3,4-dioxygenase alpha subunit